MGRAYLPTVNVTTNIDIKNATIKEMKSAISVKLACLREPMYSFFKKPLKQNATLHDFIELHNVLCRQVDIQLEQHMFEESDFSDWDDYEMNLCKSLPT